MTFRKALIPVEQVPEVAHQRIDELSSSKAFELGVYTLGTWSHSKSKTFNKCALKFLLEYILKISVIDQEADDTSSLRHIGTAAHTILEFTRQGMDIQEAYDKAKEAHIKDVTEEYWDKVESLKPNIKEFLHRIGIFEIQNPVKCAHTELKIAVDRNWRPTHFFDKNAFFRGVVDLPIHLKNGDVVILDHKHGGNPEFGLRNYEDQLDTYGALYLFGVAPAEGIATGIHFIKEGGIVIGPRKPASYYDKVPDRITASIKSSIMYVGDNGKFAHTRNTLCQYCDFKPICHGGKRGTSNLLQDVVEHSKELL